LLVSFSTFGQSSLVVTQKEVWKIDPAGTIDRVHYDFGGPRLQASVYGTTGPLVSPDQKRIAFTRGNDLWILELGTMSSTRATKVGRSYTDKLASVFVLLTSWSADSRKILYHIEKGETEDPDGPGPERQLRKAPYGDYIYDLKTLSSLATFLPGEFLGWLSDGDFLVKTGELDNAQLMHVHPGDKTGRLIVSEPGDYGQVNISPDGKQLIAGRGPEIVLIDLADGKMSMLAKGTWAEFQWPAYSPSGTHLSYMRQYRLNIPGLYGNELLIDGVSLYRLDKAFSSYWIDDETLALLVYERTPTKKRTWILLDRKTGKEKPSKLVSYGRSSN
jgi:hypothetical protein